MKLVYQVGLAIYLLSMFGIMIACMVAVEQGHRSRRRRRKQLEAIHDSKPGYCYVWGRPGLAEQPKPNGIVYRFGSTHCGLALAVRGKPKDSPGMFENALVDCPKSWEIGRP